jgi:hypothetical protein
LIVPLPRYAPATFRKKFFSSHVRTRAHGESRPKD